MRTWGEGSNKGGRPPLVKIEVQNCFVAKKFYREKGYLTAKKFLAKTSKKRSSKKLRQLLEDKSLS